MSPRIAKRKKFAHHNLKSKKKIIATVLYHKGNLTMSAGELDYSGRKYLSLLLIKWYKLHPGLESIIDVARHRSEEKFLDKKRRVPNKELLASYFKNNLNRERTSKELGYANESAVRRRISYLKKKIPTLNKILETNIRKIKEYNY